MRLDQILDTIVDETCSDDVRANCVATILTGSYQYGTYNDTSDLDLIVIHTANYKDLYEMETSGNDWNCKLKATVDFNNIETECDISVFDLSTFARRLYKGDMNAIEYINSPFKSMVVISDVNYKTNRIETANFSHYKGLFLDSFSPAIKYKLIKSCLGFINNMKETGSTKRKRIAEQINSNNLVRIANLYYLIDKGFYPLNIQQSLDMVNVELYDTKDPNFNNLDNLVGKFEARKKDLESLYNEQELNDGYWHKFRYDQLTKSFYGRYLLDV